MADSPPAVASEDRAGRRLPRLADEHLDAAYRLARAILRDATEAQDATHDAFVQAWRKWSTLRDPARFEPWFDRILVNTCRDRLRSTRRRRATDISAEVAIATGDHARRTDDLTAIGAAIATLSPDHQVVVALRYYRDLTGRRHRRPAGHPLRHRPVAPALRAQAAARGARRRRRREEPAMTDRELEAGLRAWYRAEVGETETAPLSLRRDVAAIPDGRSPRSRLLGRGRGVTLLAAAALVLVGGALAVGSGVVRLPSIVPPVPVPSFAVVTTASPRRDDNADAERLRVALADPEPRPRVDAGPPR